MPATAIAQHLGIGLAPLVQLVGLTIIACAVCWALIYLIDWCGFIPEPFAKVLKVIIVVIIGVFLIVRWLAFLGIS